MFKIKISVLVTAEDVVVVYAVVVVKVVVVVELGVGCSFDYSVLFVNLEITLIRVKLSFCQKVWKRSVLS